MTAMFFFALSLTMTIPSGDLDREIMWISLDERMFEHLRLSTAGSEINADGLIVRLEQKHSYRLHYTIRCDTLWQVRTMKIENLDRPEQYIELQSDGAGNWRNSLGKALPSLQGCRDIDIYYSPFTNTLAIRRMALKLHESAEALVAFISVPDLTVNPVRQRYTFRESTPNNAVYRYESLGSGFTADLPVDSDGLLIEYPKFFRRAWSR